MVAADAKLTSKGQLVIPQAVRERLKLTPGDRVRFVETDAGMMIEKLRIGQAEDPFVTFDEWASEADEKAYRDL